MYGFGKPVAGNFETVIERVTEELKKEGFGVLTTIDVKATIKKKLDVERRPYTILGACNPTLAHKATEAEPDIGLLLPCNVLVREEDDGQCVVSFMDPEVVLGLVQNPDLAELGGQVRAKLQRVCNQL